MDVKIDWQIGAVSTVMSTWYEIIVVGEVAKPEGKLFDLPVNLCSNLQPWS